MKKIFLLIIFFASNSIKAQDLTGRWQSADRTRIYHIYEMKKTVEAVLENSTRPEDKAGALILSLIEKRNNRGYRGIIHSADGKMETVATIKLIGANTLKLRLRRFLIPVKIRWYRLS